MHINALFDSGNIDVIDASDLNNIELAIRRDNNSDFYQWFHFSCTGEVGSTATFCITNAGSAAYPEGFESYRVCASYDRDTWFRVDTEYDGTTLVWDHELDHSTVWFAYFAPYSWERHQNLIAMCQQDERVRHEVLGSTLDGRPMDLLVIGNESEAANKVWVIGRQHPGETMAEYFIEGFLDSLLDYSNPMSRKLLEDSVFYVVPNMNPDGSVRGHLRTNAAGVNLNREWASPSMESSPEVYLVRERMLEEGGDLFLDIHGDEALPYNFVAGCEGNPSYDARHAMLEDVFKETYMAVSPDFQDTIGYPKDEPGKANLSIAANWMGEAFNTLSFTIEMPFKDNIELPDEIEGWSIERSAKLGADVLYPISETLLVIAEEELGEEIDEQE